MATPFIIVSDVHLSHEGSASTADALVKLVQASAGQEIILAGDVFGLSSDPPSRDPVESVCTLLQGYPTLLAALRRHLGSGAGLTFLAGNHDAALSDERIAANRAAGEPILLVRARHRKTHLDEIEHILR